MTSRFLVITEKPSSARRIANALDDSGKPRHAKYGKVSFYVSSRGDDELVVVSAVGHLYSIDQDSSGWTYPVFKIKWVPTYLQNKKALHTKQYLDAIIALAKTADEYISACDYDQEGSLIAYNIIKYGIGDNTLAKSRRILYSTLTSKDLVNAWENWNQKLDYSVAAAGKARHEADWLFGINLSRALTVSARYFLDSKKVLSIGRVQGPTLKFIYDQEQDIQTFIPIPYWKVSAETEIDGSIYTLEYEKSRLESEVHAKKVVNSCRRKQGTVTEINNEETKTLPPPLFNLGDLQQEAYKHHKMNPSSTLEIAQKLYLNAYISYPRTKSNKIPPSIDVKNILENLNENIVYSSETQKILEQKRYKPRQGKNDDPAHPAIYFTGKRTKKLSPEEQKIYDLIVRRFLASLGKLLVLLKTDITIDVNGQLFYLRGSITQRPGWTEFYKPYHKPNDRILPEIRQGQKITLVKLSSRRLYIKQPSRLNPSTLIRKMEQEKIGTQATRINIIDTLYRRGYIRGNKINLTDLGETTIETLERYSPEIIQVQLTRDLEEELTEIEVGNKDSSIVFENVVSKLKPILERFKVNEKQIGQFISNSVLNKTSNNHLDSCKICHRDKIEGSVFCYRHYVAHNNLETCFKRWHYALGTEWVQYLEKISKKSGTGDYVKEVINYIMG
ncbi:DNA topoisomerase I [Thermoproteota archaeon]